jgi:Reverse transcriptase (RNA-dependent DNA polymerase)
MFESEMAKIGFVNSQADPCIFLKVWNGMKCVLALYVDDSIIAGDEKLIDNAICCLKKAFNIKVQGNLEDYLGCEIKRSDKGFCIGQKRIIEELVGRLNKFNCKQEGC